MGTSRNRIRIGSLVLAAATATTGAIALAGPAAAAEDPIPPLGCGLTRSEVGALSAPIHSLEPALLPLGLAYFVHDLNCSAVINTEYLLGLQTRPSGPF